MAPTSRNHAEWARAIRRESGLSQEDFAHEIGVSFATVNRWENSKAKPSKLAVARIEQFVIFLSETGKKAHSKRQLIKKR